MGDAKDFRGSLQDGGRENFDQSADAYDRSRNGIIFENVDEAAARTDRTVGVRIESSMSAGGTGNLHAGPSIRFSADRSPNIYAIDISERMLVRARERATPARVYFIRGMRRSFHVFQRILRRDILHGLDLPPARFAIRFRQASHLLLAGGGAVDQLLCRTVQRKGEDAIRKAFPEQKYQYGAVPIGELRFVPRISAWERGHEGRFPIEVSRDFLFDFLSIPAQSAGLFPKIPYLERIPENPRFLRSSLEEGGPDFHGVGVPDRAEAVILAPCVNLT